jgi:hypothetical protein
MTLIRLNSVLGPVLTRTVKKTARHHLDHNRTECILQTDAKYAGVQLSLPDGKASSWLVNGSVGYLQCKQPRYSYRAHPRPQSIKEHGHPRLRNNYYCTDPRAWQLSLKQRKPSGHRQLVPPAPEAYQILRRTTTHDCHETR